MNNRIAAESSLLKNFFIPLPFYIITTALILIMRFTLCSIIISISTNFIAAQSITSIEDELQSINSSVTRQTCNNNSRVISNRAINIFLADKTSYLGENGDLSFYTNYVTLNSLTGTLTINHNFLKAKGIDEPLRKLFSIGVKAKIADKLSSLLPGEIPRNNLGITLNQTWLGKVVTTINGCKDETGIGELNQKSSMDALRLGIVQLLIIELNKKQTDFETGTLQANSIDVPGQSPEDVKALITKHFYEDLQEEYREKFARLQAETLTKTNNFKVVSTHWTSLIGFVPLVFPRYDIAPSLTLPFTQKHPYPFDLMLSHTRFWESSKAGKLFITVSGKIAANNSVQSNGLKPINFNEYKSLGGTDTTHFLSRSDDAAYLGPYRTFITPSIRGRVVYFSHDSHVGISFLLEQHFGTFNILNGRIGIPVVLINSKKLPALNIEFQLSYYDLTKKIDAVYWRANRKQIGVSIGIPMSRLMY